MRMAPLDRWLPEFDVHELHEIHVAATAETAFAAALGIPVAPDALVRTLFRLRGLPTGGSLEGAMRAIGFVELERSPTSLVLGGAGRPWSPLASRPRRGCSHSGKAPASDSAATGSQSARSRR